MGNTKRIESDGRDLEFRDGLLVYLRTIDRRMRNEMGGKNRRGGADTYAQTRKPTKGAQYNDAGGNDTHGTFRGRNRNYRWVNKCEEWGDVYNYGGDFNGAWGTSYYQGVIL